MEAETNGSRHWLIARSKAKINGARNGGGQARAWATNSGAQAIQGFVTKPLDCKLVSSVIQSGTSDAKGMVASAPRPKRRRTCTTATAAAPTVTANPLPHPNDANSDGQGSMSARC